MFNNIKAERRFLWNGHIDVKLSNTATILDDTFSVYILLIWFPLMKYIFFQQCP